MNEETTFALASHLNYKNLFLFAMCNIMCVFNRTLLAEIYKCNNQNVVNSVSQFLLYSVTKIPQGFK